MRQLRRLSFLWVVAVWAAPLVIPPPTKTHAVTDVLHGIKIVDPYRWLEDQNSPETRAWVQAQNEVTEKYLAGISQRLEFRRELAALLKREETSLPVARGGRYFFTRRTADQTRRSIWMRAASSGQEKLLVDPRAISAEETVSVALTGVAPDGRLIAYGVRHGGEDELETHFLTVADARTLPDTLPRTRLGDPNSIQFKSDGSGAYYPRWIPRQGWRVYYHAIGTPASADREVFGAGYGPDDMLTPALSENGRWLLFAIRVGVPPKRTEIFVQDLQSGGPARPILREDAVFQPVLRGNSLYLSTTWKAPNGRVLMIDLTNPGPEHWKEIIPEQKSALEDFSAAAGHLFAVYLENVHARLREFDDSGKPIRDVPLPGIGAVSAPEGEWSGTDAFYQYQSFNQAPVIFRYDPTTGAARPWFEPHIVVDLSRVGVSQVWYNSKDGTRVPMFVVRRNDVRLDGKRPVLMTAYGGFAASQTPVFSAYSLGWVIAGGVFALPNLRGGGEFGEAWHRAGMFEKKQNVFDDFYAAAEWLINNHYTDSRHLAIRGASNGGLLMGAAMTQRPDLFQAVVCTAPLLDMLRYQMFKVGSWWVTEYGSAENPQQFPYLLKYSPYQNVHKGVAYPAILFATGDADTRVDPLHARKMTALMQASTSSDRPILLRYDLAQGHTNGGSVTETVDESGDELAFLAAQVSLP